MDDLFDDDILQPAPEVDGMVILSVANAYKKQYYQSEICKAAGNDSGGTADHVRAVYSGRGRHSDPSL